MTDATPIEGAGPEVATPVQSTPTRRFNTLTVVLSTVVAALLLGGIFTGANLVSAQNKVASLNAELKSARAATARIDAARTACISALKFMGAAVDNLDDAGTDQNQAQSDLLVNDYYTAADLNDQATSKIKAGTTAVNSATARIPACKSN
jgi:hypothetical protein